MEIASLDEHGRPVTTARVPASGSRSEIRALTGLRGLAALMVMAYHYWSPFWLPRTTFGAHIVARGYISVDLFFILSGFVMSKAYGAYFLGGFNRAGYLRFLGRRLARIYPIYAVLVVAAFLFAAVRPNYFPPITLVNFALNMALVHVWFGHYSFIGSAWSLSTEWAAYLVFPAFVWLVLRARPMIAIVACAAAAGIIVGLFAYEVSLGHAPAYALDEVANYVTPFGRCFGGFVIGMGLFRLADQPAAAWAGTDAFGAAIATVLAVLWLVPGTPDLLLYACLPCLILCLALNNGRFGAAFSNRTVWLLGEWSYSIYLVHVFFIHGRQRTFDHLARHMAAPLADTLGVLVFYGLTIGSAAFCFTLIEVPARRALVRRIVRSAPIRIMPSAAGPSTAPAAAARAVRQPG